MDQEKLFEAVPRHKLESLNKGELFEFNESQASVIDQFRREIARLQAEKAQLEQQSFLVDDKYIFLKKKFFGRSSEKESSLEELDLQIPEEVRRDPKTRILLPSQRYPQLALEVEDLALKSLPVCGCCGSEAVDSGMYEVSECLTLDPREFYVRRTRRKKYRCGKCHGSIITTPALPRITPGGSYSDELMIDVAMSKYCDLVPIERYVSIAGREGLEDLPQNSLIETTHQVADFAAPVVARILENEIKPSYYLHVDDTGHRMLKKPDESHYLWGFSNQIASYFEVHNTRSGDVISALLKESKCEYLVSDAFSGNNKSVNDTNAYRQEKKLNPIQQVYCNAHARRKFKEAREKTVDAQVYIDLYKKIYYLESQAKGKPPDEILELRSQMRPLFEKLKSLSAENMDHYSLKSSMVEAMRYFLKNYDSLTRFLTNAILPIDNNPQERLLRNPVIGRKTWFGTQTERGAKTNAILFTIVESCKLNKINPREYLKNLVVSLLHNNEAITPNEFRKLKESKAKPTG
jgi:transposase